MPKSLPASFKDLPDFLRKHNKKQEQELTHTAIGDPKSYGITDASKRIYGASYAIPDDKVDIFDIIQLSDCILNNNCNICNDQTNDSTLDNEERQARDAETSTRNATTYDAGGQDPGVPSPYTDIGTKKTSYINPNDTGSNLTNNLRANVASQTSTPTGTLGTVFKVLTNPVGYVIGQTTKAAYQTAKFNNKMC